MQSRQDDDPKVDLVEAELFEAKRNGYFADEYSKTSLYWSSLRDLMGDNDASTQAVLLYFTGKLEADRAHASSVYANADKVFGDKKGQAKLRHDKIRQAEFKAEQKGEAIDLDPSILKPGGGVHSEPANSTVRALWELAEMECTAARALDRLCDELEHDNLLGKVKAMAKETHRQFKELSEEGDACLVRLRSVDKKVGETFLKLREMLSHQHAGKADCEDIWFLDCRYRSAVVHQKEAWKAITGKLREVFTKMKQLEAERRSILRGYMCDSNTAIVECWETFPTLCDASRKSASDIDATQSCVDRDVTAKATQGVEEKIRTASQHHVLVNTTGILAADPLPEDTSFIETLTASLESPLVRTIMMVERREPGALGRSSYYTGLMVLSWDSYIHFFDLPEHCTLRADASPAAAFQEISPAVTLDDLWHAKKDLDDLFLFEPTYTLQLEEESTVEVVSSHKSNKIEVKGSRKHKSIMRHLGSGTSTKTITFRTPTEAEMNEAYDNIKACIQAKGGMVDKSDTGYPVQHDPNNPRSGRASLDSERSSLDGERSESGYTKQSYRHVNPQFPAAQPAVPTIVPAIVPASDQAAMVPVAPVPFQPPPPQPLPQPMGVPFLSNPGWIPAPAPAPLSLVPSDATQFASNPGPAAFVAPVPVPPSQENVPAQEPAAAVPPAKAESVKAP